VPSSPAVESDAVLPAPELLALETALADTRRRGGAAGLVRLGYGEASGAIAWQSGDARYACERLPSFADAHAHQAWVLAVERYQAALAARGVPLLPTVLCFLPGAGGGALWSVQPALGPGELLTDYCRTADAAEATRVLGEVVALVVRALGAGDAGLGLDGRPAAWAVTGDEGAVCYRALTVPLVRDGGAAPPEVAAAAPAPLRSLARRLAAVVAGPHYDVRGVLATLCAGLVEARLAHRLPATLALVAPHVGRPLDARDVRRAAARRGLARGGLRLLGRLAGRAHALRLPLFLLVASASS